MKLCRLPPVDSDNIENTADSYSLHTTDIGRWQRNLMEDHRRDCLARHYIKTYDPEQIRFWLANGYWEHNKSMRASEEFREDMRKRLNEQRNNSRTC